jgi:hypothetical protein
MVQRRSAVSWAAFLFLYHTKVFFNGFFANLKF